MINTCIKFEFNPSTSWGSYARHRHNIPHGARATTDIKPWHKHTTGELKMVTAYVLPVFVYGLEVILPTPKHMDKLESEYKHLLINLLGLPDNLAKYKSK